MTAATPQAIARAGELLQAGCLVAFPTETVYGLGGDATNERAVAEIFAAKGRPHFNPLIVHVPGLAEAETLAIFNREARRAAVRFWPGPLSLVLPRRERCGVGPAARAPRRPPTAQAGSAPPRRPMSPRSLAIRSHSFSMAVRRRSGS